MSWRHSKPRQSRTYPPPKVIQPTYHSVTTMARSVRGQEPPDQGDRLFDARDYIITLYLPVLGVKMVDRKDNDVVFVRSIVALVTGMHMKREIEYPVQLSRRYMLDTADSPGSTLGMDADEADALRALYDERFCLRGDRMKDLIHWLFDAHIRDNILKFLTPWHDVCAKTDAFKEVVEKCYFRNRCIVNFVAVYKSGVMPTSSTPSTYMLAGC